MATHKAIHIRWRTEFVHSALSNVEIVLSTPPKSGAWGSTTDPHDVCAVRNEVGNASRSGPGSARAGSIVTGMKQSTTTATTTTAPKANNALPRSSTYLDRRGLLTGRGKPLDRVPSPCPTFMTPVTPPPVQD